jgi:uncharacterized protein (TIGR02145 family)
MKKMKKTVTFGLLSLCSTVCVAQSLKVLVETSYTIASVEEVNGATYQWWEDGEPISGATDASYTNAAGKASAGTYVYVRMAYKDGCGWQESNATTVYTFGTPSGSTATFSTFLPGANAPIGSTWMLQDTRAGGNNNTYKVRKMEDGHIWMVQDLMFGTCPNNMDSWYNDNSVAATIREPTVYIGYVGHCRASSQANAGYLYSWVAAMQSSNNYYGSTSTAVVSCAGKASGSTVGNPGACQGICPMGWHVPTGDTSGEFVELGSVRDCNANTRACWDAASEFAGVYGGQVYYNSSNWYHSYTGESMFYWTSSMIDPGAVVFLRVNTYRWSPEVDYGSGVSNYGYAVRCLKNY